MIYMQRYLFLFFITACSVTAASMDPRKLPPKKRFRVDAAGQMTRASVPDAVRSTTQTMVGLPSEQSAPAADGTNVAPQLSVVARPALLPGASSSMLDRDGSDDSVLEESKQQDSSLDLTSLQSLSRTRRAVELFIAHARTVSRHDTSSSSSVAAVVLPPMVVGLQGSAHVQAAAAAAALPAIVNDGSDSSDSAQEVVDRVRRGGSSMRGRGNLKCSFCARRYQQKQSLTYHELRCSGRIGDKDYSRGCRVHAGCPEKFVRELPRIKHEQHCRWNGSIFLCPFCEYSKSTSEKAFARHLKVHQKSLSDVNQLGKQ